MAEHSGRLYPVGALLPICVGLVLLITLAPPSSRADDEAPVRIGFSIARTGPNAVAAQGGVENNYTLWSEQINTAGGLDIKGQKRKVELLGYDDQSDVETSVRTYEKLMGDDKVEFNFCSMGVELRVCCRPAGQQVRLSFHVDHRQRQKASGHEAPLLFWSVVDGRTIDASACGSDGCGECKNRRHWLHGRSVWARAVQYYGPDAEGPRHRGGR